MPKRTKNHRTGKAAVTEFMKLVSDTWEVREKSGDYGVDLEIELFNSNDTATGTIAYVQSKGTTSTDNEPSVSIKVETLEYLTSFDVPSIVFCHTTTMGKSFWMWAQEAIWHAKPNAITVNLRFLQRHVWHETTPNEIERSLISNRRLHARDNYISFPILADEINSAVDPLTLDGIIAEVRSLLSFTANKQPEGGIPLNITVTGTTVQIRMERFLWRTMEAKSEDHFDLTATAIYLLAEFWSEFGFNNHAEITALKCLERQLPAPNRKAAAKMAITLINRPHAAVELALMNGLHVISDESSSLFVVALKNSLASIEEKTKPYETFTHAALHQSQDESPNSTLQYNLAKLYRNSYQHFQSVNAYNRLRKIDPSYLERTYYWYELGGSLYSMKKYLMAAICYKNLVGLENLPITNLVLGDSYLFGNQLDEAKIAYNNAKDDITSIGAEASLKYATILWLESLNQSDRPSPIAHSELLHIRDFFLDVDNLESAMWSHMALTFLNYQDIDYWADAIMLSLRQQNISMYQDVLRCAARIHGLKPYIKFKADRAEFLNYIGDLNDELDQLARDIYQETSTEEDYEPGISIGEPERLFEQGVLRLTSKFK